MTAAERREKARLRSERWRRAHGIMPRKPAQRPWLAEGISRSNVVQAAQAGPRAGSIDCCGYGEGGGVRPPRLATCTIAA
jgi:hypothetical protein